MAAENKTKTVTTTSAKETPVAKKAAPEKPVAEKTAPKKAVAPKAAAPKQATPKKPAPATAKAATKKVTETLVIQAAGSEWDVNAVKESAIAAYVAAGHQKSSISSLTVYIKPEERKAYYVINGKTSGSTDI